MSKSNVPYVYSRRTKKLGLIWEVKLHTKLVDTIRKKNPAIKDYYYYTDKVEAENHAREIRSVYRSGKNAEVPAMRIDENTVGGLIMRYKQSRRYKSLSKNSKIHYNSHLDRGLLRRIGSSKKRLQDIPYEMFRRKDALALYEDLAEEKGTHHASATITPFCAAWNHAIDIELVEANPFSRMKKPQEDERHVLWSQTQMEEMIKFCDLEGKTSIASMSRLGYELCQRIGDIRQLKWANISEGRFNFKQEKTGSRMSLKISDLVQARLDLHIIKNNCPYIFRNENTGKPYTADRTNKQFAALRKKFGLPQTVCAFTDKVVDLWINDLRTTGLTAASRAGCTDRQLMALSGHKNPTMLRKYALHGNIEADMAMKVRADG